MCKWQRVDAEKTNLGNRVPRDSGSLPSPAASPRLSLFLEISSCHLAMHTAASPILFLSAIPHDPTHYRLSIDRCSFIIP